MNACPAGLGAQPEVKANTDSAVDEQSSENSHIPWQIPYLRRSAVALEAVGPGGLPERLNELTRSRFRLLRAFSGLWLLHNARVSGAE